MLHKTRKKKIKTHCKYNDPLWSPRVPNVHPLALVTKFYNLGDVSLSGDVEVFPVRIWSEEGFCSTAPTAFVNGRLHMHEPCELIIRLFAVSLHNAKIFRTSCYSVNVVCFKEYPD